MTQTDLACVEINPATNAKATIIWLHGLGADGHDFESIVPQLQLPDDLAIRFVFPHAPMRPVTLNGGMKMPAWYDVIALSKGGREDEHGIKQAAQLIQAFITRENQRGIATDKIILAGFSQGGAMALYCGLLYPEKLAGIIGLSAYVPLANDVRQNRHTANQQTPLFLAGGIYDPIVQHAWTREATEQLQQLNYPISWHTYPMEHSVCLEEIRDIGQWVEGLF